MPPAADIIDNIVPISDFSRGKASQTFARVADDTPVIVLKNNAPIAVITSPSEYSRLAQIEEDYYLLAEALERLARNEKPESLSFDEVMAEYGITDDDIDSADEVEFE